MVERRGDLVDQLAFEFLRLDEVDPERGRHDLRRAVVCLEIQVTQSVFARSCAQSRHVALRLDPLEHMSELMNEVDGACMNRAVTAAQRRSVSSDATMATAYSGGSNVAKWSSATGACATSSCSAGRDGKVGSDTVHVSSLYTLSLHDALPDRKSVV